MSLWACLLGQVNFILHGHGWIEGGLCASYEKVILDAEMSQMMEAFLTAFSKVNKDTLGVDAIAEVGPASSFLCCRSKPLERYETEHYKPSAYLIGATLNHGEMQAHETATQRANKIWKQLLVDYKEPKLAAKRWKKSSTSFVDKRVIRRRRTTFIRS
jgi:trimethylamine--corrinoid protein Co-methyltransferase